MHKRGIVHRDIRLENLLRSIEGDLLLCDFGLSVEVGKRPTPGHINTTPLNELDCEKSIREDKVVLRDEVVATPESDIWDIGILLFHLVCEVHFIESKHFRKKEIFTQAGIHRRLSTLLREYAKRDQIGKHYAYYEAMIKMCLQFDPSKRPSAEQLVEYLESKLMAESGMGSAGGGEG